MAARNCNYCGLAWLPFVSFGLVCLTFISSYSISAARDITDTPLPFISDTGTISPASCWFGLLLNATAYTLAFVGIVRFIQVREHLTHGKKLVRCVNIAALVFILAGSFGMSMVACFQETSVLSMHLLGAILAFASAAVYACLQNYLTLTLIRKTFFNHQCLFVFRVVLSIFCVITLFTTIIPVKHAGYQLPPYNETKRPYEKAEFYYMSTVSEWTLATCFFLYILTFAHEFYTITLSTVVRTHERFFQGGEQDGEAESINMAQDRN